MKPYLTKVDIVQRYPTDLIDEQLGASGAMSDRHRFARATRPDSQWPWKSIDGAGNLTGEVQVLGAVRQGQLHNHKLEQEQLPQSFVDQVFAERC